MKLHSKKMSPNDEILHNDVSIPKLLNITLASCFLIKVKFFPPHRAHFDNSIRLPLLVFERLGFMFSVFSLHFKQ